MALKISLKPHERLIIGGAVLKNGSVKTELMIENKVPILRQNRILNFEEANTPARRIYFVIQLMYIDQENLAEHHKLYWELVHDFLQAVPRSLELIDKISELIFKEDYYQALSTARQLIDFEQEVIDSVKQCC
jgi:flagellar protein FlbT